LLYQAKSLNRTNEGNKMKTVELAKVIRKALAEDFPEFKASVRKTDVATIWVTHENTDLEFRSTLKTYLKKFEALSEFGEYSYIFETPYN
jgi:hypothetical protein